MPAFVSIERRPFGLYWFERWIPDRLEIVGEILKINVGKQLVEVYIPDILDMYQVQGSKSISLKNKKLSLGSEQIRIKTDRKEYVLKSKFFRKNHFRQFAEILTEVWHESLKGFEDKMTSLRKKCMASIQEDKKLEKEFERKLIQICESVYQPFHAQANQQEINKIASNPDTLFYYQVDERFYRYFRRSAPKPNADPQNVQTADNMAQTVLTNLKATSERIASYEKVLENLKKKRHQQRNRQKLAGLIDDLEELQMQNSSRTFHEQMVRTDGTILDELDDVLDEHADIAEKSEILKNYASTFEETLDIEQVDPPEPIEQTVDKILATPQKAVKSLVFTYQKTKESFEADFTHSAKLILGRRGVGEVLLNSISQISREHCELIKEGNQITIRDLNSTNGTFIGRIKTDCRTPQTLTEDTVIYLGREEFQIAFIFA